MEEAIEIPKNVDVRVEDRKIIIKGPKGALERDFDDPRFNSYMSVKAEDGRIVIKSDDNHRKMRAMVGTMRAHLKNMMSGVQSEYKYVLRIVYTHFPMAITVEKDEVHVKNFLGEKGARIAKIKGDVKVGVEKDSITVSGTNIEDVGQTAANIESACKLRGRDRRTFQDGIYIEKKHAKSG